MNTIFLNGKFLPEEKGVISIKTHAFQYGTGCFEGIRGYYSQQTDSLFIFQMKKHYQRLLRSAKVLFITVDYSVDELCEITLQLLKKNYSSQDFYIRPFVYKSDTNIVNFHLPSLQNGVGIFTIPLARFVVKQNGIKAHISSWTRIGDVSIPPRAKIMGSYVNTSLAKTESIFFRSDEAIFLDRNGYVVEGSAENIFMVQDNIISTPPSSQDILEGITRNIVISMLQKELGIVVKETAISRTQIYQADEVFLVGTGAEILPVVEIDGRKIGMGKIGKLTKKINDIYSQLVHGELEKYNDLLTEVKKKF